ncbi:hypothetical protein GCM10027418_03320 [Mariniluteicoccus endophyticus]
MPGNGGPAAVAVTAVVTFFVFFAGGPLQEEPGWRGFAQPRMQEHLHPLATAALIGALWTGWHAPLFFTREWDTPRNGPTDLLAYLVFVVGLGVVLAWLTNVSRAVWLAILGHDVANWALTIGPPLLGRTADSIWPAALGVGALALIVVAATRGRLGLADAPTAQSAVCSA